MNRKIDILIDGKYYSSTNFSKTCKEAVDKIIADAKKYKQSLHGIREALKRGLKITAVYSKTAKIEKKYWLSPVGEKDDFGDKIKDKIIDGKTTMGPWALMTERSFTQFGTGRLGQGWGQEYEKQKDGKWLKIEG